MFREFAAGGVVYKKRQNSKNQKLETLWLVTKSNPSKEYPGEYWRLPKGWIDDIDGGLNPGPISSGEKKASEEDLQKGALREVAEEGGVKVKIVKKIGTMRFFTKSSRGQVIKFVTFYLMEWRSDLKEGFGFETEKVEWLEFTKAKEKLNRKEEREMLEKAKRILDTGIQPFLI